MCMCVCMCVCMNVCICVCMYTCMSMHKCICVLMYTCMSLYNFVCLFRPTLTYAPRSSFAERWPEGAPRKGAPRIRRPTQPRWRPKGAVAAVAAIAAAFPRLADGALHGRRQRHPQRRVRYDGAQVLAPEPRRALEGIDAAARSPRALEGLGAVRAAGLPHKLQLAPGLHQAPLDLNLVLLREVGDRRGGVVALSAAANHLGQASHGIRKGCS